MSGIIGLLDPNGGDPSELRAAAAAASYQGVAEIHSSGLLLWGTLARDGESRTALETPTSLLVADARVDAALPGTAAARLAQGRQGIDLLAAVLDEVGPDGLEGLAADFALARWDPKREELLLARDAFGLRPLYWARRGARIGFAQDPAVLIALGLASGELDHWVVTQQLVSREPGGGRTVFAGVLLVPGGRWLAFDASFGGRRRRWFRPERVPVESVSLEESASRVRDAVVSAVADRARGERAAILLSGGRDSGAVAVAARIAGIRAACFTTVHNPPPTPREVDAARLLAEELGHEWSAVDIDTDITLRELEGIPMLIGSPIGFPAFPGTMAMRDALVGAKVTLVLDGQGGDALFTANPVAVLDLARSWMFGTATSAAKAYRNDWIYSYGRIAKTALRTLAPRFVVNLRERARQPPPWAMSRILAPDPLAGARTARELTIRFLLSLGEIDYLALSTRLWHRVGIQYACPLYDQRVVRAALGLPVGARVPVPGPKPVLAAALLGRLDHSRVKANYFLYYAALSEALHRDFPWLFKSGNLCSRSGFVRGSGLSASMDQRWVGSALNMVTLEMWLRSKEAGRG